MGIPVCVFLVMTTVYGHIKNFTFVLCRNCVECNCFLIRVYHQCGQLCRTAGNSDVVFHVAAHPHTTYSFNIFYQKTTMFVLKSLTATWLGKDISIIPVPLRENANRFVMKWKLGVLLYKNKENSDRKLLRFFLKGHLGANKNVALDVDKLLLIMFERVEKIRSLLFIKKRAERSWDGMYLSLHLANVKRLWSSLKTISGPHSNVAASFLKNCWSHESCVLYHGRWYDAPDFWCSTW